MRVAFAPNGAVDSSSGDSPPETQLQMLLANDAIIAIQKMSIVVDMPQPETTTVKLVRFV